MRYAGVGVRFVATFVDWLILGLVTAPFANVRIADQPDFSMRIHYGTASAVLSWLIALAYFAVLEGTVGATLGKLLVGIRVRTEEGTPISIGTAIVRTVLRVVDGLPYVFPYLLGAVLVWGSPTNQRLGDRVAHTVVVHRGTETAAETSSPAQAHATSPAGMPAFPPLPPPPPGPAPD